VFTDGGGCIKSGSIFKSGSLKWSDLVDVVVFVSEDSIDAAAAADDDDDEDDDDECSLKK